MQDFQGFEFISQLTVLRARCLSWDAPLSCLWKPQLDHLWRIYLEERALYSGFAVHLLIPWPGQCKTCSCLVSSGLDCDPFCLEFQTRTSPNVCVSRIDWPILWQSRHYLFSVITDLFSSLAASKIQNRTWICLLTNKALREKQPVFLRTARLC